MKTWQDEVFSYSHYYKNRSFVRTCAAVNLKFYFPSLASGRVHINIPLFKLSVSLRVLRLLYRIPSAVNSLILQSFICKFDFGPRFIVQHIR